MQVIIVDVLRIRGTTSIGIWRAGVAVAVAAALIAAPDTALAQARRPGARPRKPATEPAPTPQAAPAEADQSEPVTDLFDPAMTPHGFAGASPLWHARIGDIERGAVALPDRWRIGWPAWDRYGRQTAADPLLMNAGGGDSPYTQGHPLNPFDRNVLKGDYPIIGQDIFFNFTAVSDTFFNYRKLPTPSGVSAENSGSFDFFGDGKQLFVSQTFIANIELFRGYSAFRPVDWLLRVAPAVNINYLELEERNNVDIDVRDQDTRDDDFTTLQETFFEYHLGDTSPFFDIAAVRVGRQQFNSDFRGFLFNDIGDGARLFGNLAANRVQYNVVYFNQPEKDTNSGLNELDAKDQQVLIANAYIQDFIWYGYTTQFSFHWNHDQSDQQYDDNGFLVIPDLAGDARVHDVDAFYLGWTSDGHIDRLNVNHALYWVLGEDDHSPIAGRSTDINAFLGTLELSVDIDWFRPKVSFLYASGDDDPLDGNAEGFDGILDNPFFAGGPSSFYQSQAVRLFGVNLVSARSFYNDLAGNKAEGQANFVNPGTMLFNAGFDAELTPKLRTSVNYNSIWFSQTESVELLLNQNSIDQHVGEELNVLFQYRPFLNNNIIYTVGGSVFFPGDGFDDIYGSDETLYQFFTGLTLTY